MRKNLIIAIFCFGILAFGSIVTARGADFIVTTSQDRNGTCISNSDCSLREAVKAANASPGFDYIYFPGFLNGQIFELTLGTELIVNGGGGGLRIEAAAPYFVHIKGAGSRIFYLANGARLELYGLKLTNGNGAGTDSGRGGAINATATNSTLIIQSVLLSNNTTGGSGGAISAEGATTTITNSIISNNTAASFGGGLITSNSATVENSTIVSNRSNFKGGGAYFGPGTTTVRNALISDNSASDAGGIYYQSSFFNHTISLNHVTVSFNRSDESNSAGLHCFGTGSSAYMSIFYGNTFRFGSGGNPNVDNGCNLAVSGTNIIGGPDPLLGAIVSDGTRPPYRPLLPGSPAIDGGATSGYPATDMRGYGRAADGNGDGSFVSDLGAYEAPNMVTNTSDDAQTAGSLRRMINSAPANTEIVFNPAFFNTPRTIQMSGSSFFIDRNLTIRGPGLNLLTINQNASTQVFFITNGITLSLSGMKLVGGNAGGGDGGSIFNKGTLNLFDLTVSGGTAGRGGGIYNSGSLGMNYVNISGNTANFAAGIFNEAGATAVVNFSIVSGNTSAGGGGGIGNAGILWMEATTLSGNTAAFGGALTAGPQANVYKSTISGNTATTNKAGGIYLNNGDEVNLTNSTIANNVSNGDLTGGVYSDAGFLKTRNSIIAGNRNACNCGAQDIAATVYSYGYNLIGSTAGANIVSSNTGGQTLAGNLLNVSANLAPLGNYGGTTQTHALMPNSPAINAGDPGNPATVDQRGAPIPVGGRSDIGPFERNVSFDQATLPNGTRTVGYNQTLTATRATGFSDRLTPKEINFFNTKSLLVPFTFSIVPIAGQSLPPGLTLSSGGVLSGAPTATGSYTFTVKAGDTDGGMAGVAQYTIQIQQFNNPPTISGATLSRQAGSPASNSTIATVNDVESGTNGVTTTVTGANPSNGVTVSNIVNTSGTVTATVAAACSAANASFTLAANDGTTVTNGTLTVNVSPNTAPALGYPTVSTVLINNSLNVSPTTAADNGTVSYSLLSVTPSMTTAPTVNPSTGLVSITNANPAGTYTIVVRATDNCGSTTNASFTLNVTLPVKTVTKTADTDDGVCDADCSLREAIFAASSGDTIEFASPLFDTAQTITLVNGNLYVPNKTLTINGKGAHLTTISGNNQSRIFNNDNSNLTLNGLTMTNGKDPVAVGGGGIYNKGTMTINNCSVSGNSTIGGSGGGIYVYNSSLLTINNSTIAANSATNNEGGGGIYLNVFSILRIKNSTISGNSTTGNGGGIYSNQSNLYINDSTITANSSPVNGGGIYAYVSDSAIRNTIISGNSAPSFPDLRIFGGFFSLNDANYIGGDARLAPLGFYGGATQTHALFSNSPAINAGNNCVLTTNACGNSNTAFTTDQRGTNAQRKIGTQVDIGAFEQNITFDQTSLPDNNQTFSYNQTLTVTRSTSFAPNLSTTSKNDSPNSNALLTPFIFSIVTIPGQQLPPGLSLSSNGTISGTTTTPGTYTFTVKAADVDGMAGISQYTINVLAFNNPPTITGATISRQAGSPASNSTIANVNDVDSGTNSVTTTVTSANPSNGVTVSNIVNTNGTVTANIVAGCSATNASFTLAANDGTTVTNGTLTVNVSANAAPALAYPASQQVVPGGSLNVAPTTTGDNGTVTYSVLSVSPALVTAPTVNSSGVVSITNAQNLGDHVITIRATDNCGTVTDNSFTVRVTPPTRTVTKTADTNDGVCDSDCSLREAIAVAVTGDTIEFASPLFDTAQTIILGSELSVAGKTITIAGRAADLTAVSGNNLNRVFNVAGSGNLTLKDLTVTGGSDPNLGGGIYNAGTLQIMNCAVSGNSVIGGSDNYGGGIYNADFATVTITGSTISGNSVSGTGNFSNRCGGIANNNGFLTIRNSTISGNSAAGGTNNRGGGIYSQFRDLTIIGVTITGNSAGSSGFSYGGGLFSQQDTVILANSIISGNSAPSNPNLFGSLNASNFNLIDGDARLAPLGFYGGTTQTHALLPDSSAINAGNPVYDSSTHGTGDQRGSSRVTGGRIDIGAFENNINFDQNSLPNGSTGTGYSQQLSATRQTTFSDNGPALWVMNVAPTSFAVVPVSGQSLPPGITLSPGGLLSGTPTAGGSFNFTVKVTDTDGMTGVQQYTMLVLAPTAAHVSVSGRVITADGRGLQNAIVAMTDQNGNVRTARSSSFGNFSFADVPAGEIYVFQVISKKYQFAPQVLSVADDVTGLILTAQE